MDRVRYQLSCPDGLTGDGVVVAVLDTGAGVTLLSGFARLTFGLKDRIIGR